MAQNPNGNTIIIAIIVPACFVVLLMTLLILRDELANNIKTQHFYDWLAAQREKHPDSLLTTDPICAICLDDFDEDAQIRGLRCSHAFHAQCLDEWFGRYNEFCPLCHRTIIPGARPVRSRIMERPRPLPVAFMV
ncbi:hypothetical protein EJ07DRAFT_139949 [Lizonia empirigonia]|nr:hypothetical protein EJ07DRAFT_139949 [Lizonia empirigonia]